MKRIVQLLGLAIVSASLLVGASPKPDRESRGTGDFKPPLPVFSSEVPYIADLDLLPKPATLDQARQLFDYFSWQSFIALNWPAEMGSDGKPKRGVPAQKYSETGARVWESWKADYELYQDSGKPPSAWDSYEVVYPPAQECGSSGPQKILVLTTKSFMHGFNQAMAGPLIDQNSNLVRYEIRVNQSYYDYIKDHSLYLRKNVPAYPAPPADLPMSKFDKGTMKGTYGVIEVKAAWRVMKDGEDDSRYYTTTAYLVDPKTGKVPKDAGGKCIETKLGLVGLHIAHKSDPHKAWIWSTFEHVDNVPEDPNNIPAGAKYNFNDGIAKNQTAPLKANGYSPMTAAKPWNPKDPARQLKPVQVVRINPIPAVTAALNKYVKTNVLKDTKWQYYELIATQWPKNPDLAVVVHDPAYAGDIYNQRTVADQLKKFNDKTKPQWKYYKQPATPNNMGGSQDPIPADDIANITMETYFQKLFKPGSTPWAAKLQNFGSSCMHCHYQAAQTDFSWILSTMPYPRK